MSIAIWSSLAGQSADVCTVPGRWYASGLSTTNVCAARDRSRPALWYDVAMSRSTYIAKKSAMTGYERDRSA